MRKETTHSNNNNDNKTINLDITRNVRDGVKKIIMDIPFKTDYK
jgi:hypothetical protein